MDVNNGTTFGQIKVIALKGESGASGDYSTLLNKPSINGVKLIGNKSGSDLHLMGEDVISQFLALMGTGGVTTLWTGEIHAKNALANLSHPVTDYDFIEIFYGQHTHALKSVKMPTSSLAPDVADTKLMDIDIGNLLSTKLDIFNLGVDFVGSVAELSVIDKWSWDCTLSNAPSLDRVDDSPVNIYRIDGIKSGNSDGIIVLQVTLDKDNWADNAQTVTVTGVTATSNLVISPDPSSVEDYTTCNVYCTAQGADELTFSCGTTPLADLTVNVMIVA